MSTLLLNLPAHWYTHMMLVLSENAYHIVRAFAILYSYIDLREHRAAINFAHSKSIDHHCVVRYDTYALFKYHTTLLLVCTEIFFSE